MFDAGEHVPVPQGALRLQLGRGGVLLHGDTRHRGRSSAPLLPF